MFFATVLMTFCVSLLLVPASVAQGNNSGNSFGKAKAILLKSIYTNHQVTFYAGCAYDMKKQVDWGSCGLFPRKQPKRALRVEWEHVMPAWEFGHQMKCWQDGGRKACRKVLDFKRIESDMHNLRPSVGELNGDRSNYRYGMISDERRVYGPSVDFEVWDKQDLVDTWEQERNCRIAYFQGNINTYIGKCN